MRKGYFVIPIITNSIEIIFFVGIMVWTFVKGNTNGVTNIFIALMIVSCIFDMIKIFGRKESYCPSDTSTSEDPTYLAASSGNSWLHETSLFFFLVAHWWLAYYFLSTTIDIGYKIKILENSTKEIAQLVNSENKEKIIADQNKKMNCLKYLFILIALLFLIIAAIKSAIFMSPLEINLVTQQLLNLITPCEALIIIGALLFTLNKLRTF